MSEQRNWGSAVPLSVFSDECERIGAAAFRKAHDHAFLLLHSQADGAAARKGTDTFSVDTVFYAVPLRPSAAGLVSVGRVAGNDAVLQHATVSSSHGWFRVGEGGAWSLVDNGSHNGTFLGHEKLPRGEPGALMHPGASLRFGSLSATWLDADMFAQFVGSGPPAR